MKELPFLKDITCTSDALRYFVLVLLLLLLWDCSGFLVLGLVQAV